MSNSDDLYTPSQEDVRGQQELLQVHRQRLHYLLLMREQHEAKDVSPWVHAEIENVRQHIRQEKEILHRWQVQATDHPNDIESNLENHTFTKPRYTNPGAQELHPQLYKFTLFSLKKTWRLGIILAILALAFFTIYTLGTFLNVSALTHTSTVTVQGVIENSTALESHP